MKISQFAETLKQIAEMHLRLMQNNNFLLEENLKLLKELDDKNHLLEMTQKQLDGLKGLDDKKQAKLPGPENVQLTQSTTKECNS